MTDVLVCVKRVPDTSGTVLLSEDGQSVDARYVGFTVNAHESCAVELAVQVATATGGTATVLSLGPEEAAEQLRAALGVGCTEALLVVADPAGLGPADIAFEIAQVIRQREAAGAGFDLVLLGNDAADSGDFQVGIRLAYELGRPVVNGIGVVWVADGVATLHGDGPEGRETYRVPLPMVATVLEGGVEPRYPSISGRMKAKKVQIQALTPTREPAGSGRVRMTLPPPAPSTVEVLGEGPEAAVAVVDLFQRLGVGR